MNRLSAVLCCLALTLVGCDGIGGRNPASTGLPYEVVLEGDSDSIVTQMMTADMPHLPQPEPMFSLIQVRKGKVRGSYQLVRNLEARAEEISTRHSCGVYVAFVDDYKVYSQGGDVYEGTYRFYHDKQLGMGDGRDGVIVLLSMQNRKYAMFIYGENAAYAINEYGAEQLEGRFLGQFSDGNWYIGAAEYLTACDEYLSLAEAGNPVRESPWAVIAIVVIVSCLIASGVCKVLKMNMKTVRRGAAADEYVTGEGLALTESSDRFMYTTETRTKIKSDSSDGGGGGSTSSCSGGGGHGRSGSF